MLVVIIFLFPVFLLLAYGLAFTLAFIVGKHSGIAWLKQRVSYLYVFFLGALFSLVCIRISGQNLWHSIDLLGPDQTRLPIPSFGSILLALAAGVVLFAGELLWNILISKFSSFNSKRVKTPNSN